MLRDTKERILLTALELFAADGYEAASVSAIAGALGMTKGALYRHYKSKRDIFDSILRRMEEQDAEKARESGVPEGTAQEEPEAYRNTSVEELVSFSKEMFRYWTRDEFAALFRKMLTLEQFRSQEMGRLYQQYLAAGPLGYTADLLSAMGLPNPQEAAAEFYGSMFLFYSVYDAAEDKAAALALLDRTLESAGARITAALNDIQ